MSRTFSTKLKCGCLLADLKNDGWEAYYPCAVGYMSDKEIKEEIKKDKEFKKLVDLHKSEWEKYSKEKLK